MNARSCAIGATGVSKLVDTFGRQVTYLRLSITDRCNLRCRYCMPEEGVDFLDHQSILSYEEMERIARIFFRLGVNKIRITGGEPFVRKGCLGFMQRICEQNPGLKLHLTTNGVAVLPYLSDLKKLDLKGMNLSLDTLDEKRFEEITRRNKLETVLSVFHETLRLGIPLKVNAVIQTDTSDDELVRMAGLIKDKPVALRFIELMPFSGKEHVERSMELPLETRLFRLFPGLKEISSNNIETARRFSATGYQGTLGIIEGESRKFCGSCNKLRITSSGMMKNCLYDKGVLNLRELLRTDITDSELAEEIASSVSKKLVNGKEAARLNEKDSEESMASIGG
ncbi:GTP 3',8-cyclase MoaA [Desulfosediminicola flagellatus]|uniref:GTP 3',8-cyclase MoaA n=1 Tax=Desulfosediminicola flagellatus TaxID=2569541 RepID=UPI0010ABDDAA|nr:GTP 3',8-cyclase MoaA [Desulfosediminicola flagellatus]